LSRCRPPRAIISALRSPSLDARWPHIFSASPGTGVSCYYSCPLPRWTRAPDRPQGQPKPQGRKGMPPGAAKVLCPLAKKLRFAAKSGDWRNRRISNNYERLALRSSRRARRCGGGRGSWLVGLGRAGEGAAAARAADCQRVPNVRLPIAIAALRAQGRFSQLSARSGHHCNTACAAKIPLTIPGTMHRAYATCLPPS
jgi:hypothetical protein